jgi:hypothetical protein
LVKNEQRIWGIDYDSLRGWHEHPLNRPEEHIILETQTITYVIRRLKELMSVS